MEFLKDLADKICFDFFLGQNCLSVLTRSRIFVSQIRKT